MYGIPERWLRIRIFLYPNRNHVNNHRYIYITSYLHNNLIRYVATRCFIFGFRYMQKQIRCMPAPVERKTVDLHSPVENMKPNYCICDILTWLPYNKRTYV